MKIVYNREDHRNLKKGQIYDLLGTRDEIYLVKIKNGNFDIQVGVFKKDCLTLEEWREQRINNILNS